MSNDINVNEPNQKPNASLKIKKGSDQDFVEDSEKSDVFSSEEEYEAKNCYNKKQTTSKSFTKTTNNKKVTKNVLHLQNVVRGFFLHKDYKRALKKSYLIQELIETEKTYVTHLKNIVIEFLFPLRNQKILDQTNIQQVFNNIESIYGLNSRLYDDLIKRQVNLSTLQWADIFSHFVPFLKLYSEFISNYNNSLSAISRNIKKNPKFAKFLKQSYDLQKLKGLKLSDLLITPIQRIPRYVLLIQGVVESMDKNHQERTKFQTVLEKLLEVANYVNKSKSHSDNLKKLVNLQIKTEGSDINLNLVSGRKLIMENHLIEKDHPTPTKSWGILFNDLFISGTKIAEGNFEARLILPIDSIKLQNINSFSGPKNSFQLSFCKRNFFFFADNYLHKERWLSKINEVINEIEIQRKSLLSRTLWTKIKTTGLKPPPLHWSKGCIYKEHFYVYGGKTQNQFPNLETNKLYRISLPNKNWEIVTTEEGEVPSPRFGHTMSLVGNTIIIFGGTNGKKRFGDLHLFSVEESIWSNNPETYGDHPSARSGHSASVIGNQLWIFGGRSQNGQFLNDLFCFDHETYIWYQLEIDGNIPSPRAWHVSNFVDEQLIIFGGGSISKTFDDVWVYELRSEKWYEADVKGREPQPRYAHSSVKIGNRIWYFGGVSAFDEDIPTTILDMETATWDYVNEDGDCPLIRSRHISSIFDEEKEQILLFSGEYEGGYSNEFYILDTHYKKGMIDLKNQLNNDKIEEMETSKIDEDEKENEFKTEGQEEIKEEKLGKKKKEKNINHKQKQKQKQKQEKSNNLKNRQKSQKRKILKRVKSKKKLKMKKNDKPSPQKKETFELGKNRNETIRKLELQSKKHLLLTSGSKMGDNLQADSKGVSRRNRRSYTLRAPSSTKKQDFKLQIPNKKLPPIPKFQNFSYLGNINFNGNVNLNKNHNSVVKKSGNNNIKKSENNNIKKNYNDKKISEKSAPPKRIINETPKKNLTDLPKTNNQLNNKNKNGQSLNKPKDLSNNGTKTENNFSTPKNTNNQRIFQKSYSIDFQRKRNTIELRGFNLLKLKQQQQPPQQKQKQKQKQKQPPRIPIRKHTRHKSQYNIKKKTNIFHKKNFSSDILILPSNNIENSNLYRNKIQNPKESTNDKNFHAKDLKQSKEKKKKKKRFRFIKKKKKKN
ncbi:hypothetical protein M0812_24149 [Anaeramoeba flamelloides]|uniref:DH domain-containing protein n=1 Tax=Anaeramoeba flamelloides TaxID=1746091 RepID=A0AAV7YLE3_9EUKA|nr:hypothetical protein M0812_24149 [Anaeramoeba flamelloides]